MIIRIAANTCDILRGIHAPSNRQYLRRLTAWSELCAVNGTEVHIWQYLNWNEKDIAKKYGKANTLEIYEGMAKWAEIQYLYLIGETNVARREEYITRNREDEYGIGFRIYEERFPLTREAMVCSETPFKPGRYPFD